MPAGIIYKEGIKLYNPYDEILCIKEIYTSGSYYKVSLPEDTYALNYSENFFYENKSLWDLKPQESKNIIDVKFLSLKTGEFQGYLHIITSKDNLTIPLFMTVVKDRIQLLPDSINFYNVQLGSKYYTDLYILNSKDTAVSISNIFISGNQNEDFTIFRFTPSVASPMNHTLIAKLLYKPSKKGIFEGNITILTSDSNCIISPYKAEVVDDYLGYEKLEASIFIPHSEDVNNIRKIKLTNRFQFPLAIYKVDISDLDFEILSFETNETVLPGESWPLQIKYIGESIGSYTAQLSFYTNISTISIPLNVYDGKLTYSIQANNYLHIVESNDTYFLDLGMIKVGKSIELSIAIANLNPVDIDLVNILSDEEWIEMSINNKSILDDETITLERDDSCKINIKIFTSKVKNQSGNIYIQTPYEKRVFNISFQLHNESITLINSNFDLRSIELQELRIEHTYNDSINISNIALNDSLFFVNEASELLLRINMTNIIGELIFNGARKEYIESERFIHRKVMLYFYSSLPSIEQFEFDVYLPYISIVNNQSIFFNYSSQITLLEEFIQLQNPLNIPIEFETNINESESFIFIIDEQVPKSFIIPPNDSYLFGPITFKPNNKDSIYYGRITFKNNYTQTEFVNLVGKNINNILKVDNGLNNNSLTFQINDEEIEEFLINNKQSYNELNYISRSILLKNYDDMPLTINEIIFKDELNSSNYICFDEDFPVILEPNQTHNLLLKLSFDLSTPIIKKKMIVISGYNNFIFDIEIHIPKNYIIYNNIGRFNEVHHQALLISFKFRYIFVTLFVLFLVIGVLAAIRKENQRKDSDKISLEVKSKHKSNKNKCSSFSKKKSKHKKGNNCSLKSLFERSKSDKNLVHEVSEKDDYSISIDEDSILMKNPYYFNPSMDENDECRKVHSSDSDFSSLKTNIQAKFKPQKLLNKEKEKHKHLSSNFSSKNDVTIKPNIKKKNYLKHPINSDKKQNKLKKDVHHQKQLDKKSVMNSKSDSLEIFNKNLTATSNENSNYYLKNKATMQEASSFHNFGNRFLHINENSTYSPSTQDAFIDNSTSNRKNRMEYNSVGVIGSGLTDTRESMDEENTYQLFSPYKPNQNQSYNPFFSTYSNLFTSPKNDDIWNQFYE